jgi:aspartate ammonia-lyase
LGHHGAGAVARAAEVQGKTVRQVVAERGLLTAAELEELLTAESVTRLGSNIAKTRMSPDVSG